MPDFPVVRLPNYELMHTIGRNALLYGGAAAASSPWPVANQAVIAPMRVASPVTIQKMVLWNGTTVSGNFDVGVYNRAGTLLSSSGATAQAGVSVLQEVEIADVVVDGFFYLALVFDNTTATFMRLNLIDYPLLQVLGWSTQNTAYLLPATGTWVAAAITNTPIFAALCRTGL